MKYFYSIILLSFLSISGQSASDTLQGFANKLSGEDITYFSPKFEFANLALLTRCNGHSPIRWLSPVPSNSSNTFITYHILLGHSTGTSKANRHFDCSLNGQFLFTIETPKHQNGEFHIKSKNAQGASFWFSKEVFDANMDAFGSAYITVPSSWVKDKAEFMIQGQDEESRDWLMVFQYQEKLDALVSVQSLIKRKDQKRMLSILLDNPYPDSTEVIVISKHIQHYDKLKKGYNHLRISSYPKEFTGTDTLTIRVKQQSLERYVTCYPIRDVQFYIIHHSHNDIGYSHHQTEVEKIQHENILQALRWIAHKKGHKEKPIWHIESLWAVENFYKIASKEQKEEFKRSVLDGHIVLSANYINILTGLCSDAELNWLIEYAKQLEPQLGRITSSMVTDIPGITASGLRSQLRNGIQYLSLGPNYIESFPDHGDRVGGIIKEQGDRAFYWKNHIEDTAKLLVWTAGKGYSFFHGISDDEKLKQWEKRLSAYCQELYSNNYPYEMVQLRYTKRSDNGPVDTTLCDFVSEWNAIYESPTLHISSVPELFSRFENRYSNKIPSYTGELSPYWEDGAFSTVKEEIANRELSQKTIALETYLQKQGKLTMWQKECYALHRNIILFHEHTWGAWCSISDPESEFTTEQWKFKKAFLDSGLVQYDRIAKASGFTYTPASITIEPAKHKITDFSVNKKTGGLESILSNGENLVDQSLYSFFEPIYCIGIQSVVQHKPSDIELIKEVNSPAFKEVHVSMKLPHFKKYSMIYQLNKTTGELKCSVSLTKEEVKEKESFHLALPFNMAKAELSYLSGSDTIAFPSQQLPGSNHDFVCTEGDLFLRNDKRKVMLSSYQCNVFEMDNLIDESIVKGAKQWKTNNGNVSSLFLYVFNNYWHTNFKAYQDGEINFSISLSMP